LLSWIGKIIGGGAFLLAALMIVLTGVAGLFSQSKPDLALQLNPLNTDARINAIAQRFASEKLPAQELLELSQLGQKVIDLSPHNGRGYSLLGEIRLRQEKPQEADQLFTRTLEIAPTEITALVHRINVTLQQGQIDETLKYFDLMLRRRPKLLDKILPVAEALIRDQAGSEIFANLLLENPPWKRRLILQLSKSDNGAKFIQKLILKEKAAGREIDVGTAALLIIRMIRSKSYLNAYRTFVFTLSPTERKSLGYVFNSDFALPADTRQFNWLIRENGQADINFRSARGTRSSGGMAINFREVPARLGNVFQRLMIPPGTYQLNTTVTGRQLVVPKKLYWQLYCHNGGGELTRLQIPEGSYASQSITTRFTVPTEKCNLQTLILRTDLRTTTWRARYHGSVVFQNILITKAPQQPASELSPQ